MLGAYLRELREYALFDVRDFRHGFDDEVDVVEVFDLE